MKRQFLVSKFLFLMVAIGMNGLVYGMEADLAKTTGTALEDTTAHAEEGLTDIAGKSIFQTSSKTEEESTTAAADAMKGENVPTPETPVDVATVPGEQDHIEMSTMKNGKVFSSAAEKAQTEGAEDALGGIEDKSAGAVEEGVGGAGEHETPPVSSEDAAGLSKTENMETVGDDEAEQAAKEGTESGAEEEDKSWAGMAKRAGSKALDAATHLGETLANAVLFMIPNIFESAFLAQQALNALLDTYAAPMQFGNIVLQLPDSAMNMSAPASSDFIYYGIPVTSVGAKVSAGASAMYPGVHGPDKNNKVTAGIHQGLTKAFSLGSSKNEAPARYDMDATALSKLPIFVSYSTQSWATWGGSGIPDPTFTQMLINLNTGYVFFADGLSNDTPPADLVGKGASQSVESYLATKLGQIGTSGAMHTYTQYQNTFSSSHGGAAASPISNQFNCACLSKNGEVLSSETMKLCGEGTKETCLLVPALNTLSAGLIINADGKKMTKDQDLADEIKKGALGQVIPIKGLGSKLEDYLKFYPGGEQDSIAESGPLTISLGFGSESASGSITTSDKAAKDVKVKGADPDNYAAKGVFVYQCQNTEFAKMLRSQAGGADTSTYNNHVYDFIVFLDKELNQLPLMTPAQNPLNFHFPEMELNPAIVYVSTIIGDGDASSFTLLPQLDIKASPALVAKGMPATFPPLFGLNAQGGSLSINYNANVNSKVGAMAQALEAHDELGQQYKDIKTGMLALLYNGPFGKYKLKPIEAAMQPVIGGVNLVVYTGYNAYPVPQDEKATNCTDVLVPMSAQGKTVVLPSNNVANYYGLVSDLTYTVGPDGSIKVLESGYANSPFSQQIDASTKKVTWKIDQSQVDTYYWLNQLTAMGQGADPKFELPTSLVDFVHTCRGNWVAWVNKASTSQLSNLEYSGTPWTGTDNVLTIIGQQALVNNLYVYTCNPNPSSLSQDYFVLTNSNNPVASDKTLGTMKAAAATKTTNMLSMVSGLLYNSSGAQVKNAQGVAYQIDSKDLIQSLFATNPKGFSDDFKTSLNVAYGQFMASENMPVYPFEFYNLKLGLYQADINRGTFVYFDASGAGTADNFEPSDYFVTVDLDAKPAVWAQKLTGSTKYMMSLITGVVYSQTGPQYTLSPEKVTAVIGALSPSWRPGLKDKIDALTADHVAQQAADKTATDKMNADINTGPTGEVTWKQADVVAIIKSLSSQKYLPAPFDLLKQDPASKKYVRISPASTDGTDFLYTFFDIPNTYKDANGKQIHVGGMFDSKGNQLMLVGNLQLESMLVQNGVSVDDAGNESLGASNVLPIMLLDPADHTLKPGDTGKSMICSNHKDFPTVGIVSPMTYQNRQFYFYFNTIMMAYYVMEINGSDIRYVSMAGGDIYNLDGSCRPVTNPVAFNSADAKDMLLPYLNSDSYTQCMMKNAANKGVYGDFVNIEKSFKGNITFSSSKSLAALNLLVAGISPYNQVYVLQSPRPATIPPMPDINFATQYNVYWDESNPLTYTVNPDYKAQSLTLLPLNMTDRSFMSPMPAAIYNNARLVLKKGVIDHLLFATNLYVVTSTAGDVYTMQQVDKPTVTVTVSLQKDTKTGVGYVAIIAGATTYNYEFVFDLLSHEQLTNYQYNAWKAETVASVNAKIILVQYLPSSSQLTSVDISTVQNVPADAASQAAVTKGLTQVRKDTVDGRYVATIQPSVYTYFNQAGYVDLETGALFDDKGIPVGITLQVADLLALLNQLSVSVIRDASQKAVLMYRPSSLKASAPAAVAQTTQSRTGILGRLSSAVKTVITDITDYFTPTQKTSPTQQIYIENVKANSITMTMQPERGILGRFSSVQSKNLQQLQAEEAFRVSKLSEAEKQQEDLNKQIKDIEIAKKNKDLQNKLNQQQRISAAAVETEEQKLKRERGEAEQQKLEQQLKALEQVKKNEVLQVQIEKMTASLPENVIKKEIEGLQAENQQLLQANKNAETQIQSLQRSSKGKQSASINQQITNKRNLIAGNNSKIAANNSKIESKKKEYDDLIVVDAATMNSAAVSTTTSRAGVLGRLSSIVCGR